MHDTWVSVKETHVSLKPKVAIGGVSPREFAFSGSAASGVASPRRRRSRQRRKPVSSWWSSVPSRPLLGARPRHPLHNLTNHNRRLLDRPSDFRFTNVSLVGRPERGCVHAIGRWAKDMIHLMRGCYRMGVGGRGGGGCRTSGSGGGQIADLSYGCVSRPGNPARIRGPRSAASKGADSRDGFARTGIVWSLRLEYG